MGLTDEIGLVGLIFFSFVVSSTCLFICSLFLVCVSFYLCMHVDTLQASFKHLTWNSCQSFDQLHLR